MDITQESNAAPLIASMLENARFEGLTLVNHQPPNATKQDNTLTVTTVLNLKVSGGPTLPGQLTATMGVDKSNATVRVDVAGLGACFNLEELTTQFVDNFFWCK
ncbi:hypothetical protein [Vibrio parahaemolyticus]|uniref:hypothetical protein n=1 Tax=Vibrio parahaemolyticus TaxID=670 RepID=UPI0023EDE84F|nr:hypothetical protein [Vibrio parahaemolyticus]